MEIVVFGAGSLGSLVGGLLASVHDVTLIGRADHVEAITEDGLTITGTMDQRVTPAASTDGRELTGDLAIVTVKSADTEPAAATLATGEFDATLSLQNGLGNEATLANHLTCPVLAGTASYGAHQRAPGTVACTGVGDVVVGPRNGGGSATADRIAAAFRRADLETTVATDMPRRQWTKLAVNAAINPVTALADVDNGAVLEPPAKALARAAARETAHVASAAGIALSPAEAVAALERVATQTAANTSSMRQDVHAGRGTEIDAINGAVLEHAATHDIPVPTNRVLTALIRTWERAVGVRSPDR